VLEEQDTCIDIIAEGAYPNQRTTRDKAIIGCQTRPLAHSEEGNAYGRKNGFPGNMHEFVEWLGKHYPLKFHSDPIPRWQKQAAKLGAEKNVHTAVRRTRVRGE
jgi:hypothetical protein